MMERTSPLLDKIKHDQGPCRVGWHLGHDVHGIPFFFRRIGSGKPLMYVFRPHPDVDVTTHVVCAPNEGAWLCEACDTFVVTEGCRLKD